jgi:hypothetical protein
VSTVHSALICRKRLKSWTWRFKHASSPRRCPHTSRRLRRAIQSSSRAQRKTCGTPRSVYDCGLVARALSLVIAATAKCPFRFCTAGRGGKPGASTLAGMSNKEILSVDAYASMLYSRVSPLSPPSPCRLCSSIAQGKTRQSELSDCASPLKQQLHPQLQGPRALRWTQRQASASVLSKRQKRLLR